MTAQEGTDRAKLIRITEPPRRYGLAPGLGQGLNRLAGLGGLGRQGGLDTVGVEHAGQQVVDGHPCAASGLRATPATNRSVAARTVGQAQDVNGALTALEVMLTMRPNPRAAMPSTVAWISAMG